MALGALDALANDLHWYGLELEEKFWRLGCANLDRWREQFGTHTRGTARLVNGDSRNLVALLGPVLAECVVSSPPYSAGTVHGGATSGLLGVTNPGGSIKAGRSIEGDYGTSPGQLGALAAGSVEAVLSREADCVVSSPPYEGSVGTPSCGRLQAESGGTCSIKAQEELGITADYGMTEGQLGHTEGDTFWQAARVIVEQSFAILRPGGCAAWVVKAFVRNKAIVDFPGDWRRLCEACGFQTVEVIHASLVKRTTEASLFGGEIVDKKERKSFFRRLYEKKFPGNEINHEVVLIMVKPGGDDGWADCVVSSPPYAECPIAQQVGDCGGTFAKHGKAGGTNNRVADAGYGTTPGQLSALPPGHIEDAL